MPVSYDVDHTRRRVLATAHGTITFADLVAYQEAVWSDPTVAGYDELVDMTAVESIDAPDPARLSLLASLSAGMDPGGIASRFAIVASSDLAFGLGRVYQARRSFQPGSGKKVEVFRTREAAVAWLDAPPANDERGGP